jgi:hypothetical protein
MRSLLVAVAFLGLTTAAMADETAPTAPSAPGATTAATPQPAPSDKKICKSYHVTGELIPRRLCHTQSEWESGSGNTMQANGMMNAMAVGTGGMGMGPGIGPGGAGH